MRREILAFPHTRLDYNLFNPRFFAGPALLPTALTTATFCFPAALVSPASTVFGSSSTGVVALILLTVRFFGDSGMAFDDGIVADVVVESTRGSANFGKGSDEAVDDEGAASSSLSTISTNSRGGDRGAAWTEVKRRARSSKSSKCSSSSRPASAFRALVGFG